MKITMYEKANVVNFKGNVWKDISKLEFLNITELEKHLSSDKPLLKSRLLCDNVKCQPGARSVGFATNAITFWTNYMSKIITFDQFKE